jgi:hypothetical protein
MPMPPRPDPDPPPSQEDERDSDAEKPPGKQYASSAAPMDARCIRSMH